MQELQEERKRLQALENATNLSIDRDGNLVEAPQPDTQPASHLTVEEHGTGRRLRRREDKSGHDSTSTGHAIGITTTTSSRRKQVNNIYTFSNWELGCKSKCRYLLLFLNRHASSRTGHFG